MQPSVQQLGIIMQDEQYIISELLHEYADFSAVFALISSENFLDPWNREIFATMEALSLNDIPINPGEVYRQSAHGDIADATYLADLMVEQNQMACDMLEWDMQPEPIEACCQRIKQYAAVFSSIRRIVWSAPKPRKMSDKEVNEYLYGGE